MFAIVFTAASCRKDDGVQATPESKVIQSSILGVNGPTTGFVNDELVFDLIWDNKDATTKFDHITDSVVQNSKTIKVFALTNTSDTLAKVQNTLSYKFKADSAGTYYLKFYSAGNSEKKVIIDTIVIK